MSERWYVFTQSQLDAFVSATTEAAREAIEAHVQSFIAGAGQFSPPIGVGAPPEPVAARTPVQAAHATRFRFTPARTSAAAPLPAGKKYRVAKGGAVPYGDIVLNELSPEELRAFEAHTVWAERLEPIVETESGRARETFRRSIERDKRFRRLADRKGWWFAKVEAGTNESAAGAPTPAADSGED